MLGYIDTPINQIHYLKVDGVHTLYIEECGNPDGEPVIFLHGGPGGMISELSRRFFDPKYYRIILFDQRGCGKSTPFLCLENNSVFDSVEDIEKIRQHLDINQFCLFGGSYGTTLALAYAIAYPNNVKHMILRGIFLGRKEDIHWLFQEGASDFYPAEFSRFQTFIPAAERNDLVSAYYRRMMNEDEKIKDEACYEWSQWESSIVKLIQHSSGLNQPIQDIDRSLGLLEAHYFSREMFNGEDNYILNHSSVLKKIPMEIVHGRHDVDCRPSGAYELYLNCQNANLTFIENGAHSPYEKGMFNALLAIMERIKLNNQRLIS